MKPLSERMRPHVWEELVGQSQWLGSSGLLSKWIESSKQRSKSLPSIIFFGPPGSGKTTIARLLAQATGREFLSISPVTHGVKDLRLLAEQAELRGPGQTLLFVDEIHRFTKSQQDVLLPFVESGLLTLIGATTENPGVSLNAALLSRSHVLTLSLLTPEQIRVLLQRALEDSERGLGASNVSVQPEVVEWISQIADGDARAALNALELLVLACARGTLTLDFAKENLPKRWLRYDAGGDEHYNLISALHKSIRASQVDAALYYLMRMMEGGENPVFIARRLVRAASEDVGVADPQAAVQASLAMEAAQNLGAPECDVVLAQAVVYLCSAPKSQALYRAVEELRQEIGRSGASPVPVMIRDRVSGRFASQETVSEHLDKKNRFWPDAVKKRHFLRLEPIGFERELLKRLEYLNRDDG